MSPDTLSFMAYAIHDNRLWCSNLNFNGLYTIDLDDGKVDFIGRFIGYDEKKVGLHRLVKEYSNKLIFFPNYSTSIDIYDFSGQFSKCDISSWEINKRNRFTCAAGVYYWKDYFYVFPRFSGMNLIKYCPVQNKICEEIELHLPNQLCNQNESQMVYNCVQVNNDIYLPIFGTNYIIKYDLESRDEQTIVLPSNDKIAGRMDYDGNTFWLNCYGKINRYDKNFKEQMSFYPYNQKDYGIVTRFGYYKDLVFAIPAYLGAIQIINIKENIVQEINVNGSINKLQIGPISRWRHTDNIIFLDNKFLINPIGLKCGLQFDYHLYKAKEIMFKVPIESIPIDNLSGKCLSERRKTDLEDFLFYISNYSDKIPRL